MTAPGLRGFVLEASPGDEENLVSAALAALAEAFTVIAEPAVPGTGPHRRTWLDTFDWRLYRAGLILQFEQARRGGRLLLSQADGTPQAEQAVTSWPRRPPLDLPEGPVRDRIIVLTRPRALLPIVRAVSTSSVTRLLNADGKTVARLVADRITVTALSQPAAGQGATSQTATTAELALRLAVTEVRGYPGQARRASALLAGVPGVSPASQGAFITALTALGRHPADYSSSVAAEITAEMPAPVAVARLLLRLLDTCESNVDGVLRDIDTEFLHDLRVAVRRTRSAVKLLGAALPAELAEHYQAEFKWLGDVTTPVRDLDVHLLGFDAMAAQVEAASPADLEPLRAFLARRRAREVRRLAAALRGPRFRAIADDWRKALLELRDTGSSRRRRPAAKTLALSTTGRAFRRIAAQGGAITPASPPESLHDLRKRAKELRYLLEFFAPLHDPVAYRKVVGDLKQLQDCLGDFQDSEVQRDEISSLAEAMLAERAAPAATLLAMGEIAAKLARSQVQAREEFAARFARFAGPAGQERVRVLLEGRP
ncbi:MAG TPA: CHAD domain-containing protein [Streptosporangiaceae bacterium]